MDENGSNARKHRRKKLSYLDGMTFIDGGVVLVGLFGIIIILVIMVLILVQLYETLW